MSARCLGGPAAAALLVTVLGARAGELGDPTQPYGVPPPEVAPAAEPTAPRAWRLSMVRIGPGAPSAVVNGELVREGDAIGTALVERIEPGSVVVLEGTRRTVLALSGVSLKRPSERALTSGRTGETR